MDLEKLKVVELRTELAQRGLDTKGVKSVLVERLRRAIEEENANQEDRSKSDASTEHMNDAATEESGEKKFTKIPQTPKKSNRFNTTKSRESVTPKVQARTPRASNSRKRTSPKKTENDDLPHKSSSIISESALQDESSEHEEKSMSPDRNFETEIKETSTNVETDCSSSAETVQEEEETKAINIVDCNENSDQKSEDNSNVEQNEEIVAEDFGEEKDLEYEKALSQDKDVASNNMLPDNMLEKDTPEPINNTPVEADRINETHIKKEEDIKQEVDIKKEENIEAEGDINNEEDAKTEEKSIECKDNAQTEGSIYNTQDTDLTEEEPLINIKNEPEHEDDKLQSEEQFVKDEDTLSNDEGKMDSDTGDKKYQQDIEMTEIKHEENTDVDMKEQDKHNVRDRKRKRSASSMEEHQDSSIVVVVEDEPEIDESALVLSWYDSDLNLTIDKDGFFTATPMHSDGFSYMWAGARASYGFLSGKVYYEAKIMEHCSTNADSEEHIPALRVGWSASYTSMKLGEEKFSFGYSSTGQKLKDNQFDDYAMQFRKDDVIGCYLDATSETNVVLSYTLNGNYQGEAFSISKEELGNKPLFPHILSKNCSFACNFGQEEPWGEEVLEGFVSIGNVDSQYKIPGPRRPEKKEECEVIMMCGLPASGKTTWSIKHAIEYPRKMYNILGLSSLINKIKGPDLSPEENYVGQWDKFIDKCSRALDKLLEIASTRRRNYILDQTNVLPSAQRRRMKNFSGYQRKAVVVVPSEEEFKFRVSKHKPIDGKDIADSMLMELKANFRPPTVGEFFDLVDWVELSKEGGNKLVEKYNKEGKEAGYSGQQTVKRPRLDSKPENARDIRNDTRSSRDSRDYRERRSSNYSERNRHPVWRGGGGGNMGWRERPQRGGHMRHGGGYGPPIPWRGRGAPIPLVHRGMDRRGGSMDRRTGSDRGRGSRQGGWAPMGNYHQGSQQSVWNQQSNWSGGQSQGGWNQPNNWGSQQWSNWKSYGQNSYNHTNYNQQGYGNGNWNSWNQQYYNQYWGQQQQSGQTAASGGQAVNKQ